jgi:hypothetical protein
VLSGPSISRLQPIMRLRIIKYAHSWWTGSERFAAIAVM